MNTFLFNPSNWMKCINRKCSCISSDCLVKSHGRHSPSLVLSTETSKGTECFEVKINLEYILFGGGYKLLDILQFFVFRFEFSSEDSASPVSGCCIPLDMILCYIECACSLIRFLFRPLVLLWRPIILYLPYICLHFMMVNLLFSPSVWILFFMPFMFSISV